MVRTAPLGDVRSQVQILPPLWPISDQALKVAGFGEGARDERLHVYLASAMSGAAAEFAAPALACFRCDAACRQNVVGGWSCGEVDLDLKASVG